MNWWGNKPRTSARVLIIEDGKLLTFLRKRYSKITGEWIEYYSIPGGGIEKNETPEDAAIRELYEEMGIKIRLDGLLAHRTVRKYEHYVFHAHIIEGEPSLMMDSEEAAHMSEFNQFVVAWVDVQMLTKDKLRYYSDYYELIVQLAAGHKPNEVIRITG